MNQPVHHRIASARSVGLFGGTFDPIHNGHLLLAECAVEDLGLDLCLFMPAFIPPHKQKGRAISAPAHRLRMLELAAAGNPRFAVSTYEIEKQDVSYTYQTLAWLRETYPQCSWTLLLGADSVRDFSTWRHPELIARDAAIAAWARPGEDLAAEVLPGVPCRRIEAPLVEISSTDIRARVAAGRSVRYRAPHDVIDYINQHDLYR